MAVTNYGKTYGNYLMDTLLPQGPATKQPVLNSSVNMANMEPYKNLLDSLLGKLGMANQAPETARTQQELAAAQALVAQAEAAKKQNPVVAPTDTQVAEPIAQTPPAQQQPVVQSGGNPAPRRAAAVVAGQAPQSPQPATAAPVQPQSNAALLQALMGVSQGAQMGGQMGQMQAPTPPMSGLGGAAAGGAMGQMPPPQQQAAPQQSFMQKAGQGLMGALPGILQEIQFQRLSKPQGGVVDGMTGLTFGATDPMENPQFLRLLQQQEDARTARNNEAAFAQEMAMKEFESMLERDNKIFDSEIKMNEEEVKRFGDTAFELLKNDMMDRTQFDPVIWNAATKDRDATAMNIVASWVRPEAKAELESYARDLFFYKQENPEYQFTEQDKGVIALLMPQQYQRETQLMSNNQAHQNRITEMAIRDGYNTRQKGITLGNQLELAARKGQIGTKPGQKPNTSKEAQASPENPININAGGVTYSLQGVGNPVIVYEKGYLPRTMKWDEYKGIQPEAKQDDTPPNDSWGTRLANWWTGITGGNEAPAEAGTINTDGTEDLSLLDTGGY